MARYVHRAYKKQPKEVSDVLKKHISDGALEILERRRVLPTLSSSEVKELVSSEARRIKIPIVVSRKHFKGKRASAEGLATRHKGKSKIRLHPVIKYYPRSYIREVIVSQEHLGKFIYIQKGCWEYC